MNTNTLNISSPGSSGGAGGTSSSVGKHRSSPPSPLPPPLRVMMLDMDGTLIGNIKPQVCEYEVLYGFQKNKLKAMRADVTSRLKQGIIRPYLTWLCSLVHNGELSNIELFVYTASEAKWAAFLIPCIEEALGFKFSRPFFTRNHCIQSGNGDFKKSLDMVTPILFRKLKSKYRLSSSKQIADNIVLIDNNPSVLLHPSKESPRLVTCSTYNYAYFYDVLTRLDLSVLHQKYPRIIPVLQNHQMFPDVRASEVRTVQQFVFMYFHKMYENAKAAWREETAANIANAGKDRMWKIVGETLRDFQNKYHDYSLSEDVISTMRRRIQTQAQQQGTSSHGSHGSKPHRTISV